MLSAALRDPSQAPTDLPPDEEVEPRRAKIIAENDPTSSAAPSEEEILRRLAAEGVLTLGENRHEDFEPFPVAYRGKSASQMIVEDRG